MRAGVRRTSRYGRRRRLLGHGVLLLAVLGAGAAQAGDILSEICARSLPAGTGYDRTMRELRALRASRRYSLSTIGSSRGGRSIPLAIVHDPEVPLERLVRVFVIARQHGNEEAGTTASLALLKHFALSQGELEQSLMRQLALVVVPVANPDGMSAGRRANGGGRDLNRDWQSFSEPETRALAATVRHYQPHALIDMHELPAASSKPAYRDNFIETIGRHGALPLQVCTDCTATSAHLASWMGRSRIPVSVYYDVPGDALSLCHRYFGLTRGLPSYLFEAKCGPGRSLATRTRFLVLGTLIVANYALHRYYETEPAGGGPQVAAAAPPGGEAVVAEAPVEVQLAGPGPDQVVRGQLPLTAQLQQAPPGVYVSFLVDGVMKALTNTAPHTYLLDTRAYPDGEHVVEVQVCDSNGRVLDQACSPLLIDNKVATGE